MKPRTHLSQKQFDAAIRGTKIGRSGMGPGVSLEAARLYLVEGVASITAAAEKVGCHPNTVGRLVKRITKLAEAKAEARGLELVTVEIPKGKQRQLDAFVKTLQED